MDTTYIAPARQVPEHLRPYVMDQHYEAYTPVDHAVWRYVVRQNCRFLEGAAHDGYIRYFFDCGMDFERIPNIAQMGRRLEDFGWSTVTVDGFIPPTVFMEFQANGFLPIAQDIRTIGHINYTPAPDIVHEAAGHAPYIIHPEFRDFVRKIGEIGAKAISNWEEYAVYEAIRHLSIVKEDPTATEAQIKASERQLEEAIAQASELSEATELARIYWWTIEYGLVGSLEAPRILGAGLLSSMGEGRSCLLPENVQYLPLSLDCINYAYDITRPQPQLFVARDFAHLFELLTEFEKRMAYVTGGLSALQKAVRARKVCTAVLNSGLQLSGIVHHIALDGNGEPVGFSLTGESALAVHDTQFPEFGLEALPHGLFCALGELKDAPGCTLDELADSGRVALGLLNGHPIDLHFASGLRVTGLLQAGPDAYGTLTLQDMRVFSGDALIFEAPAGALTNGRSVPSVFFGAADKRQYVVPRQKPNFTNPRHAASDLERELHRLYAQVQQLRQQETTGEALAHALTDGHSILKQRHPTDWLLRLDMLELLMLRGVAPEVQSALLEELTALKQHSPDYQDLIARGLEMLPTRSSATSA